MCTEWPREALEKVEKCPVCGCKNRTLLYDRLTDLVYRRALGVWCLYQCDACTAAYLDPRPSPATIGQAYAEFYTHPFTATDGAPESPLKVIKRALRNGYINHRLGTNLRPATVLGSIVIPAYAGKKREIDFSLRHLPPFADGFNTLLDIGSGSGDFIEMATGIGWKAQGVEPDPVAAEVARNRGTQTMTARFEEAELPEAHFDVITLSHVIEHFHDPVKTLRKALKLLKPGGLMWIATPNMTGAGHVCFGNEWIGLDPPRHLVLFNQRSLIEALARADFSGNHCFLRGRSARGGFHLSWKITQGLKPFDSDLARLPLRLRIRALKTDLMWSVDPTREEELVLAARKHA